MNDTGRNEKNETTHATKTAYERLKEWLDAEYERLGDEYDANRERMLSLDAIDDEDEFQELAEKNTLTLERFLLIGRIRRIAVNYDVEEFLGCREGR